MWLMLPLLFCATTQVHAQFAPSTRYELSETVDVPEVDNAARMHLAQLDQYVGAEQWDEVLDTLRLLLETYDDRLIDVGGRRYISVRDYCHRRICELLSEPRERWRLSADPQAKQWYEQGLEQRDAGTLSQVVERLFASSYGDDALFALGELALERGDHASARRYWRMILPADQRVEVTRPNDGDSTLLSYPDTSLSPAEINARLVLTSILQGDLDSAHQELARFSQLHSDAVGHIAGREGKLADLLAAQLEAARQWPPQSPTHDWLAFGGDASRDKVAPIAIDIGAKQWELTLPEVAFNELLAYSTGPVRRVASSHPLQRERQRLLSYHPIAVDGLLLVNTSEEILAIDIESGEPAWQRAAIFQSTLPPASRPGFRSGGLGIPRYSMAAHNHRLYARMGPAQTMALDQSASRERRGYLVCLDLKAEGRLIWKIYPEDDKLAFEGCPVADGANIYVALRRSDVRPKSLVACYDAQTGRRRWIREVCSAETIGRGQYEETTFNLLTLHEGALFLNTNLGAVARLSTRNGHIEWLNVYRQRLQGDLNRLQAYLHRDMTPCLYNNGRLFAAPADDERILALNAETGETVWETRYAADAVHLLGVVNDQLIASGDRLYWIDSQTGKLAHYWPDAQSPRGYGRGVLAGKYIYWPTRSEILLFDQAGGELRHVVDLRYRDEAATGGNLLVANHTMIVAAGNRLIAFSQRSGPAQENVRAARAGDYEPTSKTQADQR